MKTFYKVYSIGNNAQPSYIQDGDDSVVILREQKSIGQFDSPMHYRLDKYHGIQRTKQDYSIDSLNEINSNEVTILRHIFHDKTKGCAPFNLNIKKFYIAQFDELRRQKVDIKRSIPKHYALKQGMDVCYVYINRYYHGLTGYSTYQYLGINKPYTISFKGETCNIVDAEDYIFLKQYETLYKAWRSNVYDLNYLYNTYSYAEQLKGYNTNVIYPAKPLTHIFKEFMRNVVYTPITYYGNFSSGQSAKFKYKKTAESPRQRAFTVNSVLIEQFDSDKNLNTASVNVMQKTDIVIDNSVGNISLMVQKMEFFELKLTSVASVNDLPDGVEYKNDAIKGSIANAGEYFINVTYSNNATQIINIIVPFYRRLL